MRPTGKTALAVLFLLALLAAACGNSEQSGSSGGGGDNRDDAPTVDQPGVTDTEIRVAGVTSTTNQLGGNYDDAYDGVNAYFEMVNSQGGIYDRDLTLVAEHDDALLNNQTEVLAILSQDDVFAVLPVATLLFTGAPDLADAGVPTFGWNIQSDWSEGPSLFGEKGSFLCTECPGPTASWTAEQEGVEQVGIIAYGISPQSKSAAAGFRDGFEKYSDAEVAYFNDSLDYGVVDFSAEVAAMKEAGVDLVMTAMDQNAVRNLQLEMDRQGLDAIQFLSNAYDPDFVSEFGELFDGSIVAIQFWPFEEETDQPEGMAEYLEWMDKTGGDVNEISMAGWMSADLFVTGLEEAGPEFTQQKVVDAINQLTDWDAHGLSAGVDWTKAHDEPGPIDCFALLRVTPDGYERAYGEDGKPFVCINGESDTLEEPEFRS